MSMDKRGTKEEMFGREFVEMLKDIGGLTAHFKPAHWDGKTKCPYCPARFHSLSALDWHVETVHNDRGQL